MAEALGVRIESVTFTTSGTQAVHLGMLGMLEYADGAAASAAAHSAVLECGRWAEARGKSFRTLPVDRDGRTLWTESDRAVAAELVVTQLANHEVGTLEAPVPPELTTKAGVFLNACASGARLPLPSGWDVAALSAHKWGGPPGVGVLLVRPDARWRSPWPADDRADPRAPGFENVPAALAAGAALQAALSEREELDERHRALTTRLRGAVAALPDVEVHGDPEARLPHLVAFSCLLVSGEALVTELDRAGFSVASGSACTTSALEPSHVLVAMGALTHGNLRVSLTRETTRAEVDAFIAALKDALERLREDL